MSKFQNVHQAVLKASPCDPTQTLPARSPELKWEAVGGCDWNDVGIGSKPNIFQLVLLEHPDGFLILFSNVLDSIQCPIDCPLVTRFLFTTLYHIGGTVVLSDLRHQTSILYHTACIYVVLRVSCQLKRYAKNPFKKFHEQSDGDNETWIQTNCCSSCSSHKTTNLRWSFATYHALSRDSWDKFVNSSCKPLMVRASGEQNSWNISKRRNIKVKSPSESWPPPWRGSKPCISRLSTKLPVKLLGEQHSKMC